jgi:predicted nucleic acid-binding protein
LSTVVDASLLVAAVADSGGAGRWAESILGSGALAAPELVLAEATNILWRLELGRELPPLDAAAAQRDLVLLEIELFPFAPFGERVCQLRRNLTSYDAWYVALAEELGSPLATLDKRLARSSGPKCLFLVPG